MKDDRARAVVERTVGSFQLRALAVLAKLDLPNCRRLATLNSMFSLRLVAVVPVNTGGGSMR
jgi:hypothetical protein